MTKQDIVREGIAKKIAEWNHIRWDKASYVATIPLIEGGITNE